MSRVLLHVHSIRSKIFPVKGHGFDGDMYDPTVQDAFEMIVTLLQKHT